jgi:hypothetical protein
MLTDHGFATANWAFIPDEIDLQINTRKARLLSGRPHGCPMAASAMSHNTPPWIVPIGFAWISVSAMSSMVAVPGPTSISRKPNVLAIAGG